MLNRETFQMLGSQYLVSILSILLAVFFMIMISHCGCKDFGHGQDSILKWMLVTCFGYTGYRNVKFGQIQVHERITETSRELLLQIKELAESMGFEVLHGIVDCLWVVGEPISAFKEAVERDIGILTEVDSYDWITFLPMSEGGGATIATLEFMYRY